MLKDDFWNQERWQSICIYLTEHRQFEKLIEIAEPYYNRMLVLSKTDEKDAIPYIGICLAQAELFMENYGKAEQYLIEVEKHARPGRDDNVLLSYHNIYAIIAMKSDMDYVDALNHLNTALEIASRTGSEQNKCNLLCNIATTYYDRSDTAGMPYAQKAYDISRESGKNRGVRHALTIEQQRCFMEYIANHPIYYHWWPMFTILLGTGCRIGEALGLRWQDLDFENRVISINHSLVYYPANGSNKCVLRVSLPKTDAGIRTIPMLDIVKDAFEMLYEEQKENGFNETEIDGMTGFIFCNRFGSVPNPQTVNHTIKRIANNYNADEVVRAKKEHRDPIMLPNFSCHHLRHTFCTRLCENETNLKVIQSIMGHKNIETTLDIYAEATEKKKQESFENLAAKLDIF